MEFHEKLQELRKQKGLTQEELAQLLYVSRTAVSKWESGRGYPNIDSLKAIAKFYAVSIDELLTGDGVLALTEESTGKKKIVFGTWCLACWIAALYCFFGCRSLDRKRMASYRKYRSLP